MVFPRDMLLETEEEDGVGLDDDDGDVVVLDAIKTAKHDTSTRRNVCFNNKKINDTQGVTRTQVCKKERRG